MESIASLYTSLSWLYKSFFLGLKVGLFWTWNSIFSGMQIWSLYALFALSVEVILQIIMIQKERFISARARENLNMGQHTEKKTIPSMGGIAFFAFIPIFLYMENCSAQSLFIAFSSLLFGLIGGIDDFSKIRHGTGLSVKTKLGLGFFASLAPALYYYVAFPNTLYINLFGYHLQLGIFFILWIMWVLKSTVHAVNLLDGIDGLASSQVILILFFYRRFFLPNVFIYITVTLFLFLIHNSYPAKIFMGDIGSFFLGGFLASFFLVQKIECLLPIAGVVFVLNTVACLIQICSFKLFQKRIFSFTPIHHNLEMRGWSERMINFVYSGITILGNLTSLYFLKLF